MEYTDGQKLFLNFFQEGLAFVGYKGHPIRCFFDDYNCTIMPGCSKVQGICPPMIPIYEDWILLVVKDWVEAVIEEFKPTIMRSITYYYAYGFYVFANQRIKILPYGQDHKGMSVSEAIKCLNGIPFISLPIIKKDDILAVIKEYTGLDCCFAPSVGATGHMAECVSLKGESLRTYIQKFNDLCLRKEYDTFRRNPSIGSRENPFESVDEAFDYINYLEQESISNDPFINSDLVKSRYACNYIETISQDGQSHALTWFKIPWASPYPAHRDSDAPAHSFIVTHLDPSVDALRQLTGIKTGNCPVFALKPNLYRRKFLYRGQTEEYTEDNLPDGIPTCKPNLYRKAVKENPLPFLIKTYEMCATLLQHPLAKQLGVEGVKIFNEPFRFQLNILGLAQHYYNTTPFLDLTSDIEVAKFFATVKYNSTDDCHYPCEEEGKLGVIYVYELKMPGAFTPNGDIHLSSIGKQYIFMRSAMQSGFLLKLPENMNLHDLKNVHRFYFKHKKDVSRRIFINSKEGKLYFPTDNLSTYWKDIRRANNDKISISKKARELYMLNHKDYDDIAKLNEALKAEGFNLGDNDWPEFPTDILDNYYEFIQGGGWQKFCNDIYFSGDEGTFMKRALENLSSNPAYRKAFYKTEDSHTHG